MCPYVDNMPGAFDRENWTDIVLVAVFNLAAQAEQPSGEGEDIWDSRGMG